MGSTQQPESLTAALEVLQLRDTELEDARRQIADLRRELDETNRGLIALHTELEAARHAEAAARAEWEVMADRTRIARDLHDMVLQRVFGAGLVLQRATDLITRPEAERRVKTVIDELNIIINEVRNTIFDLHFPQQTASLRAQVLDLTGAVQRGLGFAPAVSFDGPIDAAVPDEVAGHVLAVLREALSNITRHAQASAAEVSLQAGSEVVLQVSDNGRGFESVDRAGGLANMYQRAHDLGGTFDVTSRAGAGTRLRWCIPLEHAPDDGHAPAPAAADHFPMGQPDEHS